MDKIKRNFIIKVGLFHRGLFTAFLVAALFSFLKIRIPPAEDVILIFVIVVPIFLFSGILQGVREYKKYQKTQIMPKTDYKTGMIVLALLLLAVTVSWFWR